MSLPFKVYDEHGKFIASTATVFDAARLAAGKAPYTTIRWKHSSKRDALYVVGVRSNVIDLDVICSVCEASLEALWDREHVKKGHGFAVLCSDDSGAHYARNALVFSSRRSAKLYGVDLFRRWLGCTNYYVDRVDEAPSTDSSTVEFWEAEASKEA